jgi:hypothetical protein
MSKKREGLRSLGEPQRITPCQCLRCGKRLDSATPMNGAITPAPGDISICLGCGHVMAYDDDLMFRELTAKELLKVTCDPRVIEFNKLRQRFK